MTVATAAPVPRPRRSAPAPGSSLVTAAEARAVHVRTAVESTRRSFGERESVNAAWADVLASRWCKEPLADSEPPFLRAAWALVSMRIVGRSIGALSADASLRDAEIWFLGSRRPPSLLSDAVAELADREAIRALEAFAYDDALRDLLPYVLDAHGPGSRASVMKDPSTQKSRHARRAGGIFYTPSDVAEYITREVLTELGQEVRSSRILDPACGSGVFLRAALGFAVRHTPDLDRLDFVERSLHGIDISPLAIEAACFVLLHDCLCSDREPPPASPWSSWHRIRCNFCVGDALRFQPATPKHDRTGSLADLRRALADTWVSSSSARIDTEAAETPFDRDVAVGSVFPALAGGADAVVGNPPYAAIGPRDDAAFLERRFASLSAGNVAGADHYPVFVEMMWKLARPGRSSSGMVVPLSLACSSRAQMKAVRRAIVGSGGRWRFAFFDREPHALFGEDVKTRNAIVFRRKRIVEAGATAAIETGPLRKWTSRQRARLFDGIDFTPLLDSSIASGIPKLSGREAVEVFSRLGRQPARLREMCAFASACRPEDTATGRRESCVFVSGTAYNFLNVFRAHRSLPPPRAPWSSSTVLALSFATEGEAARAFAMLGSRVAFWLWHVTGDGFHVTRAFVMNLPFSDKLFNESERGHLTRLGTRLWDEVQAQQVLSVNGGRQTVAYRPHASERLRDEIDALLLGALDAEPSFIGYLRAFTRSVVAVDESDETRRRFNGHFTDGDRQCHG